MITFQLITYFVLFQRDRADQARQQPPGRCNTTTTTTTIRSSTPNTKTTSSLSSSSSPSPSSRPFRGFDITSLMRKDNDLEDNTKGRRYHNDDYPKVKSEMAIGSLWNGGRFKKDVGAVKNERSDEDEEEERPGSAGASPPSAADGFLPPVSGCFPPPFAGALLPPPPPSSLLPPLPPMYGGGAAGLFPSF